MYITYIDLYTNLGEIYLTPSFFVPDLGLVFEMNEEESTSRQFDDKTTSVRSIYQDTTGHSTMLVQFFAKNKNFEKKDNIFF